MWIYNVKAGTIAGNGHSWTGIYSGHGEGLNNPLMEAVHGVGPIPRGEYKMTWQDSHPHLGKTVALLTPIGHNAMGRTGLFEHGDNWKMNFTASDGCIIAPETVRDTMWAAGDTTLTVA